VTRPRLLDLFSKQGGAAAGYHRAGFDVTGVDIEPQPRYPYDFHQGDALTYLRDHGREFDAIHASPPCQDHSLSANIRSREMHGTGWLLDATLTAVRGLGVPFVVENVDRAVMGDALTLCGTSFGLGLHRHRRFVTSWFCLAPPCDPSRVRYRGRAAEVFGHHGNTDRIRAEWGVPWMTQDGIAQCIPPAFTEWLGPQILDPAPTSTATPPHAAPAGTQPPPSTSTTGAAATAATPPTAPTSPPDW
jgi:DNA (cytosine-5)-methyltransferase 1